MADGPGGGGDGLRRLRRHRVAPRTLAQQHAEPIALAASGPARFLAGLLGPLTSLLILLGNAITPGKGYRQGPFVSQAELRELLDQAGADSVIEDDERQMLHSVFELGDTLAREVMVPRTEMVWIEADKTLRQALSLGLRSGFSRIPVIAENLDDVVGVVYLKDVARRIFEDRGSERNEHVDTVMREAHFIPDSKRADDLLRDMQAARVHMSIVVDEYGGTAGLVTIEDILEEIVGEITDEYDNEVPEVEELATDRYRVSARLGVDDLAELVPVQVSSEGEDVDTVGGLLGRRLGWFRSPEPMSISMATGSPPSGRRDGVTGSVPSWSRNCRAARSNESGGRETTDPGTSCPRADRRCAGCGGPRRDGPQLHRRDRRPCVAAAWRARRGHRPGCGLGCARTRSSGRGRRYGSRPVGGH